MLTHLLSSFVFLSIIWSALWGLQRLYLSLINDKENWKTWHSFTLSSLWVDLGRRVISVYMRKSFVARHVLPHGHSGLADTAPEEKNGGFTPKTQMCSVHNAPKKFKTQRSLVVILDFWLRKPRSMNSHDYSWPHLFRKVSFSWYFPSIVLKSSPDFRDRLMWTVGLTGCWNKAELSNSPSVMWAGPQLSRHCAESP